MEWTVQRETLDKALGSLVRVIPAQVVMPMLTGIQCVADADQQALHLSATDGFVELAITIPADVQEAGMGIISGELWSELVHRIETPQVTGRLRDRHMVMNYGRNRTQFLLMGEPQETLPSLMDTVAGDMRLEVPQGMLKTAAACTLVSVDKPSTNHPPLHAVHWQDQDRQLVLLSTDGTRISEFRTQISAPSSLAIAVSPKAMAELARLNDEAALTVRVGNGVLAAEGGGVRFATRLIQGEFPDLSAIRSIASQHTLVVSRRDFLAAVERVALVALLNPGDILMQMTLQEQGVQLRAAARDVGESEEWVPLVNPGPSEPVTLFLNPRFCLDVGKVLPGDHDTITIHVTGTLSPVIWDDACDLGTYRHWLMPIRVTNSEMLWAS